MDHLLKPDATVDVDPELARVLGMRRSGTNKVRAVAEYVVENSNWNWDILRNCRRPDGGPATVATYHYFANLGLLLTPRASGRLVSITERCKIAEEDLPPHRWDDCLSILLDLGLTEGGIPAGAVRDFGYYARTYLGRESAETARRILRKWEREGLVKLTN